MKPQPPLYVTHSRRGLHTHRETLGLRLGLWSALDRQTDRQMTAVSLYRLLDTQRVWRTFCQANNLTFKPETL